MQRHKRQPLSDNDDPPPTRPMNECDPHIRATETAINDLMYQVFYFLCYTSKWKIVCKFCLRFASSEIGIPVAELKQVLLTALTGLCSCDKRRGHNIDNGGVFLSARKRNIFLHRTSLKAEYKSL